MDDMSRGGLTINNATVANMTMVTNMKKGKKQKDERLEQYLEEIPPEKHRSFNSWYIRWGMIDFTLLSFRPKLKTDDQLTALKKTIELESIRVKRTKHIMAGKATRYLNNPQDISPKPHLNEMLFNDIQNLEIKQNY